MLLSPLKRTQRAPFHWQRAGVAAAVAVDVVVGDSVKDKCSNHIANAFAIVLVVVVARVSSTHTLRQTDTHTHTFTKHAQNKNTAEALTRTESRFHCAVAVS